MESYINKAHKFNALLMWVFSTVLSITAYINGGLKRAIVAAAFLTITSLVATGIAYIKVKNNLIKSLVITLLPGIGTIAYSASRADTAHVYRLSCMCLFSGSIF